MELKVGDVVHKKVDKDIQYKDLKQTFVPFSDCSNPTHKSRFKAKLSRPYNEKKYPQESKRRSNLFHFSLVPAFLRDALFQDLSVHPNLIIGHLKVKLK